MEQVATYSIAPMNLNEAWNAGQVARFHAERVQRRQTVGEHSWGVALICLAFWTDRPWLIKAAILHDIPELILGDFPHPAKKICVDADKLQAAETSLIANFDDDVLSEDDHLRLKIADMFDFVLYVRREMLMGNQLCQRMFDKGLELTNLRIWDLPKCEHMRLADLVNRMLHDLEKNESRYT